MGPRVDVNAMTEKKILVPAGNGNPGLLLVANQ
jgi:hypothetical protein